MKLAILMVFSILCVQLTPVLADPGQDISQMASSVQSASSISSDDFISNVLKIVDDSKGGGLPLGLKIASLVLLILASFKVSFLKPIWAKLGKFQAAAAPILGLILGLCLLGSSGPISLASIMAYLASGAGAIALHEILDMLKGIPGIGSVYVGIINLIESALGGK